MHGQICGSFIMGSQRLSPIVSSHGLTSVKKCDKTSGDNRELHYDCNHVLGLTLGLLEAEKSAVDVEVTKKWIVYAKSY